MANTDEAPETSVVREALTIVDAVDRLVSTEIPRDRVPEFVVARAREIAEAAKRLRPHYLEDVFGHLENAYSRDADDAPTGVVWGADDDDDPRAVAEDLTRRVQGG